MNEIKSTKAASELLHSVSTGFFFYSLAFITLVGILLYYTDVENHCLCHFMWFSFKTVSVWFTAECIPFGPHRAVCSSSHTVCFYAFNLICCLHILHILYVDSNNPPPPGHELIPLNHSCPWLDRLRHVNLPGGGSRLSAAAVCSPDSCADSSVLVCVPHLTLLLHQWSVSTDVKHG